MTSALPPIPAKRYFTIGEVSDLCGVKPHVLRYWEQEFTQLKPIKRRGNRRYYQHHEVLLIRRIRNLLYEQGFTISGARQQLLGAGSRGATPEQTLGTPTSIANHDHEISLDDEDEISVTISELDAPKVEEPIQQSHAVASEESPSTLDWEQTVPAPLSSKSTQPNNDQHPAKLSEMQLQRSLHPDTWEEIRQELLIIRGMLAET